jgi:hypothetical protein
MFERQFQIEIYTLHTRVAHRSNEQELSFQNLQDSESYDQFTMAL